MNIDIASLERATLDAVAPQSLIELPDWLLPFDASTVGRAISAVPLLHTPMQSTNVLQIQSQYAERGLRTQFRVADVTGLSNLHAALSAQGFKPFQPTLTMMARTREIQIRQSTFKVQCSEQTSAEWKSVYLTNDFDPIDGANRIKALSRSRSALYAWVTDDTGSIAAGAASFSQGWASFHGLRTLARARRQGLAQALIRTFCIQALDRGLENCFLQVEESNHPAVALYEQLGFKTAWRYHYWRQTV